MTGMARSRDPNPRWKAKEKSTKNPPAPVKPTINVVKKPPPPPPSKGS